MLGSVLLGASAREVRVSAVTSAGRGITVSGLASREVRESGRRVACALDASLVPMGERVEVHLGPSDILKSGAALDLPIALEVMHALGSLNMKPDANVLALGEVGVKGEVVATRGILALASAAPKGSTLIVPEGNLREAHLARLQDKTLSIFGARTVREAADVVLGKGGRTLTGKITYPPAQHLVDFSDIIGHENAKQALAAAAVGGLNILLGGPPGCGKTLLGKASASLLPPLSEQETFEATRIWSAAGDLKEGTAVFHPPYQPADQNCTLVGMIGGHDTIGAMTKAHLGVLHIDEFTELKPEVIDSMRTGMEDGFVRIVRAGRSIVNPAKCQIVATYNPCKCGWYGFFECMDCRAKATHNGSCDRCNGKMEKRCQCPDREAARVQRRLTGPIVDRFDIRLTIGPPVESGTKRETSKQIRAKVTKARKVIHEITGGKHLRDVSGEKLPGIVPEVCELVEKSVPHASMRRQRRMAKLVLCLAALDGGDVTSDHVVQAAKLSGN